MMFMGEHIHSIDTKGRVIIPSKFRELLGDHFIVTVGLDGCLWVFSDQEWEEFSSKLRSLPVANETARKFARHFLSGADEAEPDKQGRILIPQKLRNFAKLEKDVAVVGVGNRVEIWDRNAWENASSFDDMDDLAAHMGEWGFGI